MHAQLESHVRSTHTHTDDAWLAPGCRVRRLARLAQGFAAPVQLLMPVMKRLVSREIKWARAVSLGLG
jgi:hypothetical protein